MSTPTETAPAETVHTPLPRDVRPFIKWAGGKRSLVAEIAKRMPKKPFAYHEPFLGGGAMFFELYKRGLVTSARLADVNEELVNAFRTVRDERPALIGLLERHAATYSEEHYYQTRAADMTARADVVRAARFIFLNRTCFNGLYRVNRKGQFNVPWGKYESPGICDVENLTAVSHALGVATVFSTVFANAMTAAGKGDVVYCDPPYLPTQRASKKDGVAATSFTAYASGGFGIEDHARLSSAARDAAARGALVIVSNSDMPEIRTLYTGSLIETVRAPRAINSKGSGRGEVNELLITVRP